MLREFLRGRLPYVFAGMALGCFVLWSISFAFGLPGYVCEQTNQTNQGSCGPYNLLFAGFWNLGIWLHSWSDFITGIATALLTFITFYLFRLEKESGENTRTQLRAYVGISESQIHDFGVGKIPRAQGLLKNSGQTPARKVTSVYAVDYFPFPLPADLPAPPF